MPKGVVERAKVLRSKNAGPFVITLDVIFGDRADFQSTRQSISAVRIAQAFKISEQDVLGIDFVDQLNAMKVSIRRRRPCGHPGDPDCYGMNQEQPLAQLLEEMAA
jgi:hypothetical protein